MRRVLLPYLPSPSRPPSPSEAREGWARSLGWAHAVLGTRLAEELQQCMGENGVPPGEGLPRDG